MILIKNHTRHSLHPILIGMENGIEHSQFRIRLINLVDNLIDILEKDKTFSDFTIDDQTIVLEDYL